MFVGKRFIFNLNVDCHNIKGVICVYVVTCMMKDFELFSPRGLSVQNSQSNEQDLDTSSTVDSSKVYTIVVILNISTVFFVVHIIN